MIWRNGEGYYDPTAGEAISNIIREEKLKARKERAMRGKEKTSALAADTGKTEPPEMCFAYIPANLSGDYRDCTALSGYCPGFKACHFYRGMTEHEESLNKAYAAIRRKPQRAQLIISLKYYYGRMPWRIKEEE